MSPTNAGTSTPVVPSDIAPNSRSINENTIMPSELSSGLQSPASGLKAAAEPDYLQMILSSYVYDVATETPLTHAVNLSTRIGNSVFLKREDLQPVFSFKIRGAYNQIRHLTQQEMDRGLIAGSAGNHAQGVAMSAKHLGIKATIVMPILTPAIKWQNVKRLGADVVLHGAGFDEAKV
ncbi:threonine deaminase, partial [Linderina macrospora]